MIPRSFPGWSGVHIRTEASGGIPNGTRVQKIRTEPGDTNPVGAIATVLGSFYVPDAGYAYFVEWDTIPKTAVLVVGWKIERLGDAQPT